MHPSFGSDSPIKCTSINRLFRTEVTAISYSKTAFFIETESLDLTIYARPFIIIPVSSGWRQFRRLPVYPRWRCPRNKKVEKTRRSRFHTTGKGSGRTEGGKEMIDFYSEIILRAWFSAKSNACFPRNCIALVLKIHYWFGAGFTVFTSISVLRSFPE